VCAALLLSHRIALKVVGRKEEGLQNTLVENKLNLPDSELTHAFMFSDCRRNARDLRSAYCQISYDI
jgi:hypothetical protein